MEAAVEARDADERIKIYGFLFEVYEPEYMFFECFEAVRRLSLTGLMVVVQPGTAFQCVVGWAIATLSIKIIATTRPFVDDADDALTEAAMWSIMLVFFGALLIRVDVEGDSDAMRDAMGATLVVVTVLPVVIGLVTVLYSARLAHVAEPEEQPSDGAIITDNPMLSQQARASFFEREGGVELKRAWRSKTVALASLGRPRASSRRRRRGTRDASARAVRADGQRKRRREDVAVVGHRGDGHRRAAAREEDLVEGPVREDPNLRGALARGIRWTRSPGDGVRAARERDAGEAREPRQGACGRAEDDGREEGAAADVEGRDDVRLAQRRRDVATVRRRRATAIAAPRRPPSSSASGYWST
ncbi:hypothetical protein SO694_00005662 [Aureococcus anophagefferens]|uniref:TRP C-terminal domain-containing protein n=1 Tax=Aureococcus anophagefferens TaxID=44056 RepID=A0ABR1G9J2_AURAN